jgi:hypothetical protein
MHTGEAPSKYATETGDDDEQMLARCDSGVRRADRWRVDERLLGVE